MFQYTTETIINSNDGNLVNGKRFGIFSADVTKVGDTAVSGAPAEEDFILIDGTNTFKIENIKKIYKSPFRPEQKEEATLTIPTGLLIGDILSLTVTLSELGNVRSTIQNAYLHHTKPFHYEIEVESVTPADIAKKLGDLIKKDMAMTDFHYFHVSVATNVITFKADDCYIRFDAIKLGKVEKTPIQNYFLAGYGHDTITHLADGVVTKKGDQGAGTVARIVKDLRIPTNASINPFGADHGGRPIPGKKYDQYLIEYETERRHVAGTVVGSVDRSLTSHVFFVANDVTEWDTMINSVASALKLNVTVNNQTAKVSTAGQSGDSTASAVVSTKGGNKSPEQTMVKKTEMGSVE